MERAIKPIGKSHNKVLDDQNHVDRLSDLPDEVICRHILSFLSTKESVQTSILAKRWRTLWAHVPFIDIVNPNPDCEGEEDGRSYTTILETFSGIVCTVLSRHKAQTLNTFSLICPDKIDEIDEIAGVPKRCNELEACVATVVERNVRNLHLDLKVEVPPCLLTCKTLVDLTLGCDVTIPPTAPFSFPNLKKLHLLGLMCEVDFTRLLSGCPVLEELKIRGTPCRDPRGCYISSPTLKSLSINNVLDQSMLDNPNYMVTITTPALTYLKVDDIWSKHFSISPCTSLVEADISLLDTSEFKYLDSISNVKCLQLTGFCSKVLQGAMPGPIAKFGNLTKLDLCADWRMLLKFLESADRLQVLSLRVFHWIQSDHWTEPIDQERCACLLYSLRTVRISYTLECKNQVFYNVVRFILRNAQVLERMEIDTYQWEGVDLKEKSAAIKKISSFRRGSTKCELHFP